MRAWVEFLIREAYHFSSDCDVGQSRRKKPQHLSYQLQSEDSWLGTHRREGSGTSASRVIDHLLKWISDAAICRRSSHEWKVPVTSVVDQGGDTCRRRVHRIQWYRCDAEDRLLYFCLVDGSQQSFTQVSLLNTIHPSINDTSLSCTQGCSEGLQGPMPSVLALHTGQVVSSSKGHIARYMHKYFPKMRVLGSKRTQINPA